MHTWLIYLCVVIICFCGLPIYQGWPAEEIESEARLPSEGAGGVQQAPQGGLRRTPATPLPGVTTYIPLIQRGLCHWASHHIFGYDTGGC